MTGVPRRPVSNDRNLHREQSILFDRSNRESQFVASGTALPVHPDEVEHVWNWAGGRLRNRILTQHTGLTDALRKCCRIGDAVMGTVHLSFVIQVLKVTLHSSGAIVIVDGNVFSPMIPFPHALLHPGP